MAYGQVQQKAAHFTAAGSNAVTLSAAPTAGNLLIAVEGININTGQFAAPTSGSSGGWALAVSRYSGQSTSIAIYFTVADGTEGTSFTWTTTAGNSIDLQVVEFSGIGAGSMVDKTNFADSGTGSVSSQASGTTAPLNGTGDLVFAAFWNTAAVTSPSFTNSFTGVGIGASGQRIAAAWLTDTDQTAKSTTVTVGSAGKMAAAIAAISPVPVAADFIGWGIPL